MTKDPQLTTALTWCADNADAKSALRRDTRQALAALGAAQHLYDATQKANSSELVKLQDEHRAALAALVDTPTRDNARKVSDLVAQLDDTQVRQVRDLRTAEHALAQARHRAGRVFATHVLELLRMVAQVRCKDVTACGDDAVPDVVRDVWRRLMFRWHPNWNTEVLMLPAAFGNLPMTAHRQHLPLTWHATDPDTYRASLAWVWQQLAAGNFQEVHVPLDKASRLRGRAPGSLGTCVRITTDPDTLPAVPRARTLTDPARR